MALFRVPGDFSSLPLALASPLVRGGDSVLVQNGAYNKVVVVPFDRARAPDPRTVPVAKACVRFICLGERAAPSLVKVRRHVWERSPGWKGNRGSLWLRLK